MLRRMCISALIIACFATAPSPGRAGEPRLMFERSRIGTVTFEAASAFDVNNDGKIDIFSGEYWFEGPDFTRSRKVCDLMRFEDYYDDFSNFPMDVNGDGYLDVITGGWWGQTLCWLENPKGKDEPWKKHAIDKCGNVETARFWDVDGDGQLEAVPNAGNRIAVYRLDRDGSGKGKGSFSQYVIKPDGCGHGFGFGDVNGDGRGDFIVPDGWIEAPEKPYEQPWAWHPEFRLGVMSDPVIVYDVNKDGLADLIVGQAHDYGLAWYEQGKSSDGKRTWTKHDIDTDRSQYHDLVLVDIDNDKEPELVTGKRYRAHQEHDPGSLDPLGLYYFKIDGGKFRRFTIDNGPAGRASGAGIYLWVADIDGNGWKDIVAPGKDGLFLFKNRGPVELRSLDGVTRTESVRP